VCKGNNPVSLQTIISIQQSICLAYCFIYRLTSLTFQSSECFKRKITFPNILLKIFSLLIVFESTSDVLPQDGCDLLYFFMHFKLYLQLVFVRFQCCLLRLRVCKRVIKFIQPIKTLQTIIIFPITFQHMLGS
jgi:hypothetical protein